MLQAVSLTLPRVSTTRRIGDYDVTRVYSAQNALMVDHLKHVLDADGIGCAVLNRHVSGMAGRLPPNECWTELWVVDDEQLPAARDLIEQALQSDAHVPGEPWVCANCGEQLDPEFEACWKCCLLRGAVAEEATHSEANPPAVASRRALPSSALWVGWGLIALVVLNMVRSCGGTQY